jgi:uncharacterized repeat protein (TIGR01451 family)
MVAPLPCGKFQPTRGVGAKAPAWGRAAACRAVVKPVGIALFISGALAVIAQEPARAPRGLIVSSALEPIVAPPTADAADPVPIAADSAAPHAGEHVVTVRFTNAGGDVVDTIRITSPVPADLQYVPDSASGPGSQVLFSVDDGRTFGRPDELTSVAPDGAVRSAAAAEYTHVRWVLRAPLDAGATGIARFRAAPR